MNRRGRPEWRYKQIAIRTAAQAFRNAIDDQILQTATFVPIPPSKAKDHPEYDNRMTQLIMAIDTANPVDCRELIVQSESTAAAHESDIRPAPRELEDRYAVDPTLIEPRPTYLILIDDVLTTGSHFRAAKRVLQQIFPELPIVGYFVARRVPETLDVEAFFDNQMPYLYSEMFT